VAAQGATLNDADGDHGHRRQPCGSGARASAWTSNGDGREDVFILLGGANSLDLPGRDHDRQRPHGPTPEVPLVGQPSNDVGHYGDTTTSPR
jgi:hypothetical protein